MKPGPRLWLKILGGMAVFAALLIVAGLLMPKPVAYRIYGVEDEATGGWMFVKVAEGSDPPAQIRIEGGQTGNGRAFSDEGIKASVETFEGERLGLLLKEGGAARRVTLALLAEGQVETSQTGWGLWGRASFLTRESTVLSWQPAMPNGALWEKLEGIEREIQWAELDKEPLFAWADWFKSLHPDEPKDELETRFWQDLLAMGRDWVVLKRLGYDFSGGAHGNSWSKRETFWADRGTARQLGMGELFGGEIPWPQLMPHLRKAYADWGKGGSYLDAKEVDKTLRESASLWPNATGLVFSYDPYAIAPYSEGAPDLKLPLSAFADAVDWKGPARLIWPKEAARRAK